MKSNMNIWLSGFLATVMVVGTVGCGQGFQTGSSQATDVLEKENTPVNVDQEIANAQKASADAQSAITEAQAVIQEITDSKGNINLNLFKKASKAETTTAASPLTGLTSKLRGVFDKVFDKVAVVRVNYDNARKNLADALAKLDRNDPVQAEMVNRILSEMAKIDVLEKQFLASIKGLASKLDLAITGLDKLVSGITSFIPGFGWVVNYLLDWLVIDDVKTLILELKYKLMNL